MSLFLFVAVLPCETANCNMNKPNSTCEQVGYKKGYECNCDDGFYEDKNDKCIGM